MANHGEACRPDSGARKRTTPPEKIFAEPLDCTALVSVDNNVNARVVKLHWLKPFSLLLMGR